MVKGLPNIDGKAERITSTVKSDVQTIALCNNPLKESHCITSEGYPPDRKYARKSTCGFGRG